MKRNLKGISFLLTIIMVFSLVACKKGISVEEQIREVLQTVSEAKSYEATMIFSMEAEDENMSIDLEISSEIVQFYNPIKLRMLSNIEMMGISMNTEQYLISSDTGTNMYMKDPYTGKWTCDEMRNSAVTPNQYDIEANLQLYLSSADSFELVDTIIANGVSANVLEGYVSAENLENYVSQVLQSTSPQYDAEQNEMMKHFLSGMEDIQIVLWIEADTNIPIYYSIDMTDLMQGIMNSIISEAQSGEKYTISKMIIEMGIRNMNNAKDFELPEEILYNDSI